MLNHKKIDTSLIFLLISIVFFKLIILYLFSFERLILNLGQNLEIFLKEPLFLSKQESKKKIFSSLTETVFSKINNKNNFDTIDIDINFNNFEKLKKNRINSLKNYFLIREDNVPVNLKFNDKIYKANIRLKGDTSQHWYLPKQWSFKIDISDNDSILGMKSFAITRHNARSYPLNIIVSDILSEFHLLTPKYGNLYVNINGNSWGLMHYEELPSNAYIETKNYSYSNLFK